MKPKKRVIRRLRQARNEARNKGTAVRVRLDPEGQEYYIRATTTDAQLEVIACTSSR